MTGSDWFWFGLIVGTPFGVFLTVLCWMVGVARRIRK